MSLNTRLLAFAQAVAADIKALMTSLESAATIDDVTPSTSSVYSSDKVQTALSGKVDVVSGKGLSTNDYTTNEQIKLGGMSSVGSTLITAASTMAIGASPTEIVTIPGKIGTTSISAFDTAPAGVIRYLYNTGIGTKILVYNATSLILPGSANITLTAGSTATLMSLGSGNWVCIGISMANGQAITGWTGGTLTSAINEAPIGSSAKTTPTYNLASFSASNTLIMTSGAAGEITSLGTSASGMKRVLVNDTGNDVIFTYNATSMILPMQRNLSLGNGDVAEFTSLGSGNWRLTNLQLHNGSIFPQYIGIGLPGTSPPAASLDIAASTAVVTNPSRSHIKMRPQALSTTPEEGTIEYDNNGKLWWSNNVGRRLVGSPGFSRVFVNAAATGNVSLALSSYTLFDLTLAGDTVLDFSSVPPIGAGEMFSFTIRISCGATPYSITWPAGVITTWLNTDAGAAGVAPAANKMVEFSLTTQNGTTAIARKVASN